MSSPAVPALFRRLLRSVDKRLTIPSARASSEAEEAESKDNASSSHSSSQSSSTASVREYIIEGVSHYMGAQCAVSNGCSIG